MIINRVIVNVYEEELLFNDVKNNCLIILNVFCNDSQLYTDYCQPANSPPITEISPVMSPVASDCGLDSSSPLYAVELSDSNDVSR